MQLRVCPQKILQSRRDFGAFSTVLADKLMYRLDLNDNASFTLTKPKID